MRTARVLAAVAISVVVLAGCESATEGTAQTPPAAPPTQTTHTTESAAAPADLSSIQPCELLTHGEAQKLARTPLDEGVTSPNRESPSCTYTGPPSGPTAQVELHLGPGAKKYFDVDNKLSPRPTLPNLADEAYTYEEGLTVYFRKGTTWAVIHLVRLEDHPHYMKILTSLAHTVADRLPTG